MPILDLAGIAKDLLEADRQRQGFEMLIGLLLAHLQDQPGYSDAALLEAVREASTKLSDAYPADFESQDFEDPAILPFERLEGILRSRMGCEIRKAEIPKEWTQGYPNPCGPKLRNAQDD